MKARRYLSILLGVSLVCFFGSDPASAQNQNSAARSGNAILAATPAAALRRPSDAWVPRDIDAATPAVKSSVACSLTDIVEQAGKRVEEMVGNLDRFTATEFVEHQSVSGSGKLAKVQTRKFDYLVSIGAGPGRYLAVQEFRGRASSAVDFPDGVATVGTPSLVLVFHPLYAPDFDMKCEGLSSWRGQPAWQVRFEQRADQTSHLSNVIVRDKLYNVRLRGRAWILAGSHQVARLETDLAETIPAIKLRIEHMNVEYQPVTFAARDTQLWLPSSAELYLDFAQRRFYRQHRFTDFTLFSVDVDQQIAASTQGPAKSPVLSRAK